LRQPAHERADDHAERTALVDALPHERPARALGHHLGRREGRRAEGPLAPGPRAARIELGHLPHDLRQARLRDREAVADLDGGAVERDDPLDRRRPLRPALHVGEHLPDDRRRSADLDTAVRDHTKWQRIRAAEIQDEVSRLDSAVTRGAASDREVTAAHFRLQAQRAVVDAAKAGEVGPSDQAGTMAGS
jgi:hypothetical protein